MATATNKAMTDSMGNLLPGIIAQAAFASMPCAQRSLLQSKVYGTVNPVRGAWKPRQSLGPVELFGRAAVTHVQGLPKGGSALS